MKKKHETEQAPTPDVTAEEQDTPRPEAQEPAQAGADGPAAGADGQAAPQEDAAPRGDGASEGELAASRERYLRLAAEFDNYRKRVEREKSESWNRAQAQLAEKLLDVLDDLQRVARFNPETATAQSLLEGTQMVERKLQRALESAGVEEVEAEGQPFDPAAHEALMTVPADSREEDDTVADVFQKGYRFKGILLRPARVRVKRFEG
ncbi:MAG TPA: nucleotide exchange factor GrpE [Longimicrobiaceae bacterium]|nr:nucleotide exchange factor GrpE [Longimicrobiaceae bacterium]